MLILVCGLPGTGKTTIAKALSQATGYTLIRTDVIRKELLNENKYTEKERDTVYEQILTIAGQKLRGGEDCILDGTFYKKSLRNEARETAEKNGSKFHLVECVLHEDSVKKRINARKGDESEADFAVYRKLKKTFEPITRKHIVIDTSKGTKNNIDKILEDIKK
ncbi:MAG: AAA family ATPase [Candidatus Aenigmarchaeota archaeon]|nr:AAA family ATPase [Candidatus Aenigmarchaeota archaeon]